MPKSRRSYPPEFRRQLVELVATGSCPAELAREFGPRHNRSGTGVAQAAPRDAGHGDGGWRRWTPGTRPPAARQPPTAAGAGSPLKGGDLVARETNAIPPRVAGCAERSPGAQVRIAVHVPALRCLLQRRHAWRSRRLSTGRDRPSRWSRRSAPRMRPRAAPTGAAGAVPTATKGVTASAAAPVARLMSQASLAGVSRRRFVTTTVKRDGRQAPDLVERHFTAEAPDRLWVADEVPQKAA